MEIWTSPPVEEMPERDMLPPPPQHPQGDSSMLQLGSVMTIGVNGYSLVVEHMLSVLKVLGSSPEVERLLT